MNPADATLARQTHVLTLSAVPVHRRAPDLHHRRRDPPRRKKPTRKSCAQLPKVIAHLKGNGAPQALQLGQQEIDAGGSGVGHCLCVWIHVYGRWCGAVDKTSFFLHVIDALREFVILVSNLGRGFVGSLIVERPREVIHGVPRDAALDRIFKVGAQNLRVVNRILQLAANLDAAGRLRAREGHDPEHHFTFRVVFSLGAIRARNQPRTSFHQTVLVLLLSLALLGLISRVDVLAGRRQRNLLW